MVVQYGIPHRLNLIQSIIFKEGKKKLNLARNNKASNLIYMNDKIFVIGPPDPLRNKTKYLIKRFKYVCQGTYKDGWHQKHQSRVSTSTDNKWP